MAGTVYGTLQAVADPLFGSRLSFNGSDAYIGVDAALFSEVLAGQLTVEGWLWPDVDMQQPVTLCPAVERWATGKFR